MLYFGIHHTDIHTVYTIGKKLEEPQCKQLVS